MEDIQVKWIGEVSGVMEVAVTADKAMEDRGKGIEIIQSSLDENTLKDIQSAFADIKLELSNGKTMGLLDLNAHDPMNEIDTVEDLPGASPVPAAKLQALGKQVAKIKDVQTQMQQLDLYKIDFAKAPFVDGSNNSIYDPDLPTYEQQKVIDEKNNAMARDLWQPLMREGIIPENMIPDKYSEVAQTFAGASEAYEERLQDHSENMSKADIFLEKFAPIKDIGGKAIAAAGSFTSFAGDAAALAKDSKVIADVKEAADIIEMINVAFTATCDIVPVVVKERDAIKVVDIFNDALGKILASAGVDKNLTDMIGGIITCAARSAATGKKLAAGDLEGAFDELGEAIGAGFGATGDAQFKEIGEHLKKAVGSMGAAAKSAKAMTKKPPEPGKALEILLKDASKYAKGPEVKAVLSILANGAGALPQAYRERDAFAVMDFVGGSVAEAMKAGEVDPMIANAVNSTIRASISGAGAGKALAEGDISGGFDAIGKGIAASLKASGDADIEQIGLSIQKGIAATASATSFVAAMQKDPPDLAAATSAMNSAVQSALGDSSVKSAIDALKDKGDSEGDAVLGTVVGKLDEIVESEVAAAALDLTNLEKPAPITKEQLEALEKARAELEEKAARSEEEKLRLFMEEEDAQFKEMLVTGLNPVEGEAGEIAAAEERRLKSIENMIAIVQRDKKTFELAQKICTKGPQLLADLVPGMSLVQACTEMAFMIAEAVKHAEQLLIWADSMEDAGKAATVQLDAIMNRYGLEKQHVLRGRISIGIQAVKIAGEATKLSPAAPIGLAISSGADAAASGFDLLWSVEDFARFQVAWSTYKKALENPQNRKAARMALRKNATLSKYAMAYGALHDGNAIAKEAMRRCNITEATLAQPETNVSNLVEYLEELYSDDPVIVKAVPVRNDWYPGEVELSSRSFSRFYMAACREAGMAKDDVSKIKGALSGFDLSYPEFKRLRDIGLAKGEAVPIEAEHAVTADTQALVNELKAHKATVEEGGSPHKEFNSYCKTLAAQATLRWREIQKIVGQEQQPMREKAAKKHAETV